MIDDQRACLVFDGPIPCLWTWVLWIPPGRGLQGLSETQMLAGEEVP